MQLDAGLPDGLTPVCGRYMITSTFEAMAHLFEATLAELGPDDEPRLERLADRAGAGGGQPRGRPDDRADALGLLPPLVPQAERRAAPDQRPRRGDRRRSRPSATRCSARRCLVPADGFYEWRARSTAKSPMVIRPRAGGPGLRRLWGLAWPGGDTDLRHRHLPGQRGAGADPRPDAGGGRAGGLRALARRGGAGRRPADGAGAGRGPAGRAGPRGDPRGARDPGDITARRDLGHPARPHGRGMSCSTPGRQLCGAAEASRRRSPVERSSPCRSAKGRGRCPRVRHRR